MIGLVIVVIGIGLIIYGLYKFGRGIYYYRLANKQHKEFLETEKDFKEYQEYKKEMKL